MRDANRPACNRSGARRRRTRLLAIAARTAAIGVAAALSPVSGPTAALAPVLAALRARTREAHEALDACLPDGLHDRADYLRYLQAMRLLCRWMDATDDALVPTAWRTWRDPRRAACLDRDLLALGGAAADLHAEPPCGPEWVGACYVLEGSALGGRLLVRQATALASDDPGVAAALSFLRHHTADPGRWRGLVRMVETLAPAEAAGAARGAARGFAIVRAALSCKDPSQ